MRIYRLVDRMADGLARLNARDVGTQLWTRAPARKATPCATCRRPILPRALSWRPVTNGANRMDRICDACVASGVDR